MSSINVREERNRFRDRLLDLSNANRLLNYRKTKTRSVQIVHARLDHIMQRLVQQGKPFRFQWTEESELRGGRSRRASQQRGLPFPSFDRSGETNDIGTADVSGESLLPAEPEDEHRLLDVPDEDPPPIKQRDDTLQTDRTETGLERVLTTIRRAANNAIEETGVNYLYIALGMLDWNERAGTTRRLLSPLILVPVKLQREFDNRRHRYETNGVCPAESPAYGELGHRPLSARACRGTTYPLMRPIPAGLLARCPRRNRRARRHLIRSLRRAGVLRFPS